MGNSHSINDYDRDENFDNSNIIESLIEQELIDPDFQFINEKIFNQKKEKNNLTNLLINMKDKNDDNYNIIVNKFSEINNNLIDLKKKLFEMRLDRIINTQNLSTEQTIKFLNDNMINLLEKQKKIINLIKNSGMNQNESNNFFEKILNGQIFINTDNNNLNKLSNDLSDNTIQLNITQNILNNYKNKTQQNIPNDSINLGNIQNGNFSSDSINFANIPNDSINLARENFDMSTSKCEMKIDGECKTYPNMSNHDWFDDSKFGGPKATTLQSCKDRQKSWENSCSDTAKIYSKYNGELISPIIGGCKGTRYNCCPDGKTAKSDSEGTNCPDYKSINQIIKDAYKSIYNKNIPEGMLLYFENEIELGNLKLSNLKEYFKYMKMSENVLKKLYNGKLSSNDKESSNEKMLIIKNLTDKAIENKLTEKELEGVFLESDEYKNLINKDYNELLIKDEQEKELINNIDNVGGCSGTQFGCCDDGKTTKKDEQGSNCIKYKGNKKSVYVLGSFGIKPWNSNQNNKPYFENSKWIWSNKDAQIDAPVDEFVNIQYIYFNKFSNNINAKLYVIIDNSCSITLNNKSIAKDVVGGWLISDNLNEFNIKLIPGNNLLTFKCKNAGGPAGLLVSAMYNNNLLFVSDNNWVYKKMKDLDIKPSNLPINGENMPVSNEFMPISSEFMPVSNEFMPLLPESNDVLEEEPVYDPSYFNQEQELIRKKIEENSLIPDEAKPQLNVLNSVYKVKNVQNINLTSLEDVNDLLVGGEFKLRVNLPMLPPYLKGEEFDTKKGKNPNIFYLCIEELEPNCNIKNLNNSCTKLYVDNKNCKSKILTSNVQENSYRFVLVTEGYVKNPNISLGNNSTFTFIKVNGNYYLKNIETGLIPCLWKSNNMVDLYANIDINGPNNNVIKTNNLLYNQLCNEKQSIIKGEKEVNCKIPADDNMYFISTKNLTQSSPVKLNLNNGKISLDLINFNRYGSPENYYSLTVCNYNINTFKDIESVNSNNINFLTNLVCINSNTNNKLEFDVELSKFPDNFISKTSIYDI